MNSTFSILQVPSSSSSKKSQGKRGPKKPLEGRFIIIEVDDAGKPVAPEHIMTKLVNHIGALVRDHIPISIPYWKASHASPALLPKVLEGDDENAQ